MAKAETHAIKALATLVALSQFKGQKNESSLHLCVGVVEELSVLFERQDARRRKRQRASRADALPLLFAAKMLGIYGSEKAGAPTNEWTARIVKALKRSAS